MNQQPLEPPPHFWSVEPDSLEKSIEASSEKLAEYGDRYWDVLMAYADGFWRKSAMERRAFYLSREPIGPFLLDLAQLGRKPAEEAIKMARDWAKLQEASI